MRGLVFLLVLVCASAYADKDPFEFYQPDPAHRGDPHYLNPYEYFCSPAHTRNVTACKRVVDRIKRERDGEALRAQNAKEWDELFRKYTRSMR